MYKPQTVEQFKIYQYLQECFDMNVLILSPLSRNSLILEDRSGAKIAFVYGESQIKETKIPAPISQEEVRQYIINLKASGSLPLIHNYVEATHWWLNHPNPLTYQQALGLSDTMYRHFLTRPLLTEEDLVRLARSGLVTEKQLVDMKLWVLLNRLSGYTLVPASVYGMIGYYKLIAGFLGANEVEYEFAIKDEYYCEANKLPYPYEQTTIYCVRHLVK